jgi:uncharacterized protein
MQENIKPKIKIISSEFAQAAGQYAGQCDCGGCDACSSLAVTTLAQSYDFDSHRLYNRSPNTASAQLTAFHCLASPYINKTVVTNNEGWDMLECFNHPNSLDSILSSPRYTLDHNEIKWAVEQFISHGLLMPTGCSAPTFTESSPLLTAWLHLTDRCNLRCAYCYLPHAAADMSAATGRAAIEATFRSALAHGYQKVKFKYSGGEPLLRFPMVTELHRHAQMLAGQHGLTLDGIVLSNGTLLTPEIVEKMQALNLRLMISLDGLGEQHNRQRAYANGRGSAADTLRAVEMALQYGLTPDISITISQRNAAGLPELVDWVLERRLPFSLNFYRENDCSAAQPDLEMEEEYIIEKMLAAYRVIEAKLPRHSLLGSLGDRANLGFAHLRPCSVGRDYLAFDLHGRIAKCQMALGQTSGDVSAADPLAIVRDNTWGLDNPSIEAKSECGACQWRYWCAGGCPLLAHRAVGRYDAKSPNCNIYRALYPEILRLEGLRLLKYADTLQ